MKHFIKIILALLILSSCSCRQETVLESEFKNDCYFHDNDLKPYSGICVTYFNKTQLVKAKRMFKEGLMDGPTVIYYNNGSVQQKGFYRCGKFDGKWTKYFPNGNTAFEINHKNGKLDGSYTIYYENGNVKEKGKYSENKRIGKWQYFSPKGDLVEEFNLSSQTTYNKRLSFLSPEDIPNFSRYASQSSPGLHCPY